MAGTLTPTPFQTVLDTDGVAVSGALIYTYVGGTTTAATTYADASLATPNTNPIVADSAGRFVAYLPAGGNFKFTYKTAAGATIEEQDNILSVPGAAVNLDIEGTVGEAVTAGQVCYLSTGAEATPLTAGLWYLTDADFAPTSTTCQSIGVAVSAISINTAGTIRLAGTATMATAVVIGSTYYVSATAGAITATPPALSRTVGVALTTSTLLLAATTAVVTPAGSNTQVQFNDAGVLGGDSGFTFIKATDAVAIVGPLTVGGTLGVTGVTTLTGGLNTPLVPAQGGTGLSSYAVGDLVYASGATTLAKLADVAVGQVLVSGGVATAPAYSASPGITALTYTTSLKSTTALATPAALTATQATAFASTVSGAAIMGYGTTNDVALMNRAGTVVLGIGPNTTTVNMTGLLSVTGFGTHSFSAGGTGSNILEVRNTTSGTANFSNLRVTGGTNDAYLYAFSQGYTTSGPYMASATVLQAAGSAGLNFAATDASGAIRFYSGGTTQRLSLNSDGSLTFGTSSATVGMIRLPNNEFSKGRNAGNTADLSIIGVDASNKIRIDADGTGSVMSGALSVAGALSKGSGSFLIDHPLAPDTDDLYHGFVEAPRHDLIYRGEVDGSGSYDIDEASRMRPGTFIALTQHPQAFAQHADGAAVQARVVGGQIVLACQTPGRIGWLVFAERADPFIRTSPSVDSDGRLIPETPKLNGQGRRH